MTGPCSGAVVGVPKPGFAAVTYIGPSAIGGALAGLSGWAGAAVGASIGALTLDLATFCPDGPPTMPTFDATDIVALLNPGVGPLHTAAALKFQDFLGNVFWPSLCDCPGGTSVVPAPTAFPSDAPTSSPIVVPVTPCATFRLPYQAESQNRSVPVYWLTGAYSTVADNVPIPSGATLIRLHSKVTAVGAVQTKYNVLVQPRSATLANLGSGLYQLPATPGSPGATLPDEVTSTLAVPAGTVYLAGTASPDTPLNTDFAEMTLDVFCGSAPGQSQVANCSPDPQTQAMLAQILQYVTLIQRQTAPFAYIAGTPHAGLSGTGTIDVQGLIGASVTITALPDSYGRARTAPTAYFELGFITWQAPDGSRHGYRVEFGEQVMFPPQAGVYTALSYDLSPGVVITLTELLREP